MHGHRRRRHAAAWLTGAATILVLGAAALTAGLLRLDNDEEPESAAGAPADPAPARDQDQVTIDLDPTSGFVATVRGTDATRQFVTAQELGLGGGAGRYAGEVSAYDPGTFDPARLRGGETVQVKDHDAVYLESYPFAERSTGEPVPYRAPAIAWADAGGVWVLVYAAAGHATTRADLQRLAASVTLAPPRDLRTPFRFGPVLPAGLAATYVHAEEDPSGTLRGTVGLGAPGRRPSGAAVYRGAPPGVAVTVLAAAPDARWRQEKADLAGDTTVAGHPAWYRTGRLVVETEHCVIQVFATDHGHTGRDSLGRLVEDMVIGDCANPDTWITPLP
jgi:hypothetical protein